MRRALSPDAAVIAKIEREASKAAILVDMPMPLRFGREWFIGDLDEAAKVVGDFLDARSVSYLVDRELY